MKKHMKKKHMTIKNLSEITVITTVTIWRILNQKVTPTLNNAQKIAKALGTTIEELFDYSVAERR
jgi:transcriptional regulator with XRE-family HTH domain